LPFDLTAAVGDQGFGLLVALGLRFLDRRCRFGERSDGEFLRRQPFALQSFLLR
jgi:hypothetical protein